MSIAHGVTLLPDGIEFRLQRELKNHNSGNRHPHWSVKARERKAWRDPFVLCVVDSWGVAQAQALLGRDSGFPGGRGGLVCQCLRTPAGKLRGRCRCPPTLRRTVTITRLVPSSRNFIRDDDNLRWAGKELRDALTSTGLIRDDSSKWADMHMAQAVSGDLTYWTIVRVQVG